MSKEQIPDSDLVVFFHKLIKLNFFKQCLQFKEVKDQCHTFRRQ